MVRQRVFKGDDSTRERERAESEVRARSSSMRKEGKKSCKQLMFLTILYTRKNM